MVKKEDKVDILADFGEDFGVLSKQDIGQMFVDIHAAISPLDPMSKIEAFNEAAN